MQKKNRKPVRMLILILFYILSSPPVFGRDLVLLKPWQMIQTRYTLIKYKSGEDLVLFDRSVRFGAPEKIGGITADPFQDQDQDQAFARRLEKKVDALFERIQEILDMNKDFEPVNVHLYSDTAALKAAYEGIYPGECRLRAWYRFANNTVYLNVRDVHEGMLAHELAHAVIDHFLTVRPPPQTAEILARYVDTHLERGFVD